MSSYDTLIKRAPQPTSNNAAAYDQLVNTPIPPPLTPEQERSGRPILSWFFERRAFLKFANYTHHALNDNQWDIIIKRFYEPRVKLYEDRLKANKEYELQTSAANRPTQIRGGESISR